MRHGSRQVQCCVWGSPRRLRLAAILAGLNGPLANDFPYTPYTDVTLKRLAALEARTLAVMHGSSFHGETRRAILDLAAALKAALEKPG